MLYFEINNNEKIERACRLFIAGFVIGIRYMPEFQCSRASTGHLDIGHFKI
jgi:hypothetical protein